MKFHLLSAVAAAALLLGTAAHAGPVIIDGTDSADHGTGILVGNSGVTATNTLGWEYMQRALTNLGGAVSGSVQKTLQVIGTNTNSTSYNAITSAFALSGLGGAGWNILYVQGAVAINAFMAGLSTGNTGILYLSTAGLVSGDMDAAELGAVNAAAGQINNYVSGAGNPAQGGALFAQGETGTGGFGWLSTLIPGIVSTDVGGGGLGTDILLTAAGFAEFPGLTNADLAGADPWHTHFSGNLGGLSVLGATAAGQSVIIGGGAGTVISVPEPGSLVLVAMAGLALLGARRRLVK